jgi:hypothetical protein
MLEGVGANRIFASEPMSLLEGFIAANQRLEQATEKRLPAVFKCHIQTSANTKPRDRSPADPDGLEPLHILVTAKHCQRNGIALVRHSPHARARSAAAV